MDAKVWLRSNGHGSYYLMFASTKNPLHEWSVPISERMYLRLKLGGIPVRG